MDFPLSRAWWASVFNLLLAWEDFTGEWGASWTIWLLGGGAGKDKLGQPRCWETVGGQSLAIHHFQEPRVAMRREEAQGYQGLAELGKEAFQA
jgi:hypothetical protein